MGMLTTVGTLSIDDVVHLCHACHTRTRTSLRRRVARVAGRTGLWRGVLGMNQTFISSDCSDIGEIKNSFALATDDAEAAAVAINAGVSLY